MSGRRWPSSPNMPRVSSVSWSKWVSPSRHARHVGRPSSPPHPPASSPTLCDAPPCPHRIPRPTLHAAPCAHLEGPDDCGLAWLYLPQLPLTASVLSSSAEATQGPTPADTTTVDHSRGAAGAAAPKPPAPGGRGAHHGPPPLTLTGADEAPPDAAHASRRNVLRAGGLDKGPVGPPPSKALPGPLPIGPAALRLESGPGTKGVTLGGPGPRGGGGPMRAAGAPAPAPVPVSAVLASRAPAASSAEPGRAGPRPQELPLLGAAGGLAPAPALGPATTPTTTTERGPSPAVPQPAPPAPSGRPASPTCTPAPSTPRLRAPPTVRALSPIGFLYSPTDLTTPIKGPLIVPVVHSASPSPGPPWRGASPPRTAAATAGPHPLQAPAVLSPGAPPAADRRGSPCLIAGIYSPADAEGAEVGTQAAPVGFALSPCDDSGAEEGLCAAAGVPGNVLPEAPLRPDGRESCPGVARVAGRTMRVTSPVVFAGMRGDLRYHTPCVDRTSFVLLAYSGSRAGRQGCNVRRANRSRRPVRCGCPGPRGGSPSAVRGWRRPGD